MRPPLGDAFRQSVRMQKPIESVMLTIDNTEIGMDRVWAIEFQP